MIDRKKMTTLLINVISVKMLLTFPKVMIINSGNAAWIECIYNTLIVIGLFWITTKLYRSNKNIIQLAEMIGILIADLRRDFLNAHFQILRQQVIGLGQTNINQIMNRCVSGFLLRKIDNFLPRLRRSFDLIGSLYPGIIHID